MLSSAPPTIPLAQLPLLASQLQPANTPVPQSPSVLDELSPRLMQYLPEKVRQHLSLIRLSDLDGLKEMEKKVRRKMQLLPIISCLYFLVSIGRDQRRGRFAVGTQDPIARYDGLGRYADG